MNAPITKTLDRGLGRHKFYHEEHEEHEGNLSTKRLVARFCVITQKFINNPILITANFEGAAVISTSATLGWLGEYRTLDWHTEFDKKLGNTSMSVNLETKTVIVIEKP
ncbi:MAG: hypothetical protein ABL958_09180 [Bdellovibrionia bacterium]